MTPNADDFAKKMAKIGLKVLNAVPFIPMLHPGMGFMNGKVKRTVENIEAKISYLLPSSKGDIIKDKTPLPLAMCPRPKL